jgi:flagellar hook-basal body complex protein FliE
MDPLTIQNTLRGLSGVGRLGGPASEIPRASDPQTAPNILRELPDLDRLGGASPEIQLVQPGAKPGTVHAASFQETLASYLEEVNRQVLASDQDMADLASGKSQNIHNALIAMQKADLQVRLLVETRNKVMQAYDEIMRMQT